MGKIEKFAVIGALVYMALYVPFFFYLVNATPMNATTFDTIIPFHIAGMVFNFVALVLTIRDLYKRPFDSENAKLTWALLILMTGGIGWVVYVFKYALKPRRPMHPG